MGHSEGVDGEHVQGDEGQRRPEQGQGEEAQPPGQPTRRALSPREKGGPPPPPRPPQGGRGKGGGWGPRPGAAGWGPPAPPPPARPPSCGPPATGPRCPGASPSGA